MAEFTSWLNQIPLAGLMLVVALGFTLGRVSWRGIALGPAGGTILVALLLGREGLSFAALYGSRDPQLTVGIFGFSLFIYSVGFEAGPRFFTSIFGGVGWRFVVVACCVNVVALVLAVVAGHALSLGDAASAGLLSGALTSPPTYAAAQAVIADPNARALLALTFALAYPVGLAVVIVLVQFLPRLMGDDLAGGLEEAEEGEPAEGRALGAELTRAFEVRGEEVLGRPLRELDLTHRTGCYVMRLHRDEETESVDAGTVLQPGDRILVKGRFEELQAFAALVGPEVYDEDLRRQRGTPRAVRVREREVIGRSLAELDLARAHRCLVTQVDRGDVALEPSAELRLERDDLVHVVGRRDDLRAVAARLGRFRRSTSETDIAVYAGGILLGLLIGRAHLDLHGTHFTLGTAGGLLLTGVLLGRFRDLGPLHANVPRAARQLVRDLGILLFVTEAGVRAGESLAGGAFGAAMGDTVLRALGGAVAVTAAAVILPVLLGRWLLKLRPADAWGSLGGGMTSSAALSAIRRAADSNAPALSYAAAYAVASVLATIAGQVVVLWMH